MSKVFSVVEMETSTGQSIAFFASGIPDRDDIQSLDEYMELAESCEDCESISASIYSYIYGAGESEPADEDELPFFEQNFDRLQKNGELDYLTNANYYIEVENEYDYDMY